VTGRTFEATEILTIEVTETPPTRLARYAVVATLRPLEPDQIPAVFVIV
jgi:hypothetical protein